METGNTGQNCGPPPGVLSRLLSSQTAVRAAMCTCTGLALPSSQENLPHHRHQWIMSADGSQGSRGRRTIWTRDQSGSFSVGLPFLFPLWLQVPSVFSLTASVFLSSDSSKNVSPFPTTLPSALLGPSASPAAAPHAVPLHQGLQTRPGSFLPHFRNSREWVKMQTAIRSA